ncbi:SDR family NAD(P)-dependent oxidoreductase [Paenibacillus sp. MBLB4367]|uniref:SDR family NAD(P)-dependent oxidoreductase n=1 Tax=Paenibacillus sp. MBLB4367 TaxID=3384767 RepID=UPI0039084582
MKLRDKVALVTGGATGIGKAVCLAYAAEGAKVVVNYWNTPEEAEQVVAAILEAGGQAMMQQADVSSAADVERMIREVGAVWGGVDIVVNNAGIYPNKTWFTITEEEWDRVMNVNLKSCFLLSKAVFPYMKERRYGKIINVSSVTFLRGQKGFVHYVASKGGIVGFTRALAREVGEHGISVNAISPGAVLTEQELLTYDEESRAESAVYLAKEQCFSRRELPSDMVGGFVFLASPDSDFVTGQLLNIDGGWVMH